MRPRRRDILSGLAASAVIGPAAQASVPHTPLREIADRRQLLYGCAMKSSQLKGDPEFTESVLREANSIVAEYEMKRLIIQKQKGRWDFTGADKLMRFALRHRLAMRGHPLVWYHSNPPWLAEDMFFRPDEKRHLVDYIERVAGRYRAKIHSWDVVNECVHPQEGGPNGMRVKNIWMQAFGEQYIDTAFHAAREADPHALRFYGDFGVEHSSRWHADRRRAVLRLLERLLARNVPIDGFGIQGHLKAFRHPFVERELEDFMAEISGMGLKIMVSELDVADRAGPADIQTRDEAVATLTRRFLEVVMDNPASIGVLTWGLSDRYSWLSVYPEYKWPDGSKSRGLPLDENLERKPMWHAIANTMRRRPPVR